LKVSNFKQFGVVYYRKLIREDNLNLFLPK